MRPDCAAQPHGLGLVDDLVAGAAHVVHAAAPAAAVLQGAGEGASGGGGDGRSVGKEAPDALDPGAPMIRSMLHPVHSHSSDDIAGIIGPHALRPGLAGARLCQIRSHAHKGLALLARLLFGRFFPRPQLVHGS